MIIFSPIAIPYELLELKGIRQVVNLNLSSYQNVGPVLNALLPSVESIPEEVLLTDCTGIDFDLAYHSFIMNNNASFIQFMNIVIPAYMSPEALVHVYVKNSPYSDAITESLVKLIQQRYGYNAYIINEVEDFIYTEESDFSIPGLFILDQDLQMWRGLTGMMEEVGEYE